MTVKSRVLSLLRENEGEFVRGEDMAAALGCSRNAVWKAVRQLKEEGQHIESDPKEGYRLVQLGGGISAEGIRLYLDHPEVSIKVYETLPSTNQAAKEAAIAGTLGHGALVIAREQTQGRGRQGKAFFSPAEAGVYFSIVLEPKTEVGKALLITTAAATAVYRAVKALCALELSIKWVNDLYYRGRKVCGILTEAVSDFESGGVQFVVVGFGINLAPPSGGYPPDLLEVAGSLFGSLQEAKGIDPNRLVAQITNGLLSSYGEGMVSEEYVARNLVPGRDILVKRGMVNERFHALSIASDGALMVERIGEGDVPSRELIRYGEIQLL